MPRPPLKIAVPAQAGTDYDQQSYKADGTTFSAANIHIDEGGLKIGAGGGGGGGGRLPNSSSNNALNNMINNNSSNNNNNNNNNNSGDDSVNSNRSDKGESSFDNDETKNNTNNGSTIKIEDVEILEKLGEGASSTVHKAYYRPSNIYMAVKCINVYDRSKRHQLIKELSTLYNANSEYLVGFYGAFYKSGSITICIELMDAGSLHDILYSINRPIPEIILGNLTYQILQGLYYLRRRHHVHRDIKPSNICLSTNGHCKLTDFGITSELENSLQACESFVGSYNYMAPERIMGKKYSYPSDIWSLGLVLIECATCKFPYPQTKVMLDVMQNVVNGPSPTLPTDRGFSDEFHDFVNKTLIKDPDKRSSAHSLLSHPWIEKYKSLSKLDVAKWITETMKSFPSLSSSSLSSKNNDSMNMTALSRALPAYNNTATPRALEAMGAEK